MLWPFLIIFLRTCHFKNAKNEDRLCSLPSEEVLEDIIIPSVRLPCITCFLLISQFDFSVLISTPELIIGLYCFLIFASCHVDALFRRIITVICLKYHAILGREICSVPSSEITNNLGRTSSVSLSLSYRTSAPA